MPVRACIFDFDGTLVDSMWVWEALGADFCARAGIEMEVGFCSRLAQLGLESASRVFVAEYGLDESPEDLFAHWLAVVSEKYSSEVFLKPGAKEFLRGLAAQGIKLGVATANRPGPLRLALENNGVAGLFDVALSADEVTDKGKSTPEVYWAAAERLGAPVSECLVFEDVLGPAQQAHSGGFRVVGVYDDSTAQDHDALRAEADAFIESYVFAEKELAPFLS